MVTTMNSFLSRGLRMRVVLGREQVAHGEATAGSQAVRHLSDFDFGRKVIQAVGPLDRASEREPASGTIALRRRVAGSALGWARGVPRLAVNTLTQFGRRLTVSLRSSPVRTMESWDASVAVHGDDPHVSRSFKPGDPVPTIN
jgi:hypothetical protein